MKLFSVRKLHRRCSTGFYIWLCSISYLINCTYSVKNLFLNLEILFCEFPLKQYSATLFYRLLWSLFLHHGAIVQGELSKNLYRKGFRTISIRTIAPLIITTKANSPLENCPPDKNFPNRIFQGKVTKFPYFPHKSSIQCSD